ncbi:hypothetical protein BS47DRAFT_1380020 [Hydnum rufescens UP504]|uniref:Major facilitator superfamily (MFS) profile domain-containing protein n=1 Tax=Hydnum rufescens UP504 TaxID=1448309 RepID=A0A9P6B5F4_9AGAM|nr:hypothetical protein BS47DRAFT_1380020 [Hydnum rufescens UP504]
MTQSIRRESLDKVSAEDSEKVDAHVLEDIPSLTAEEEKRLYRKIDLRLMPILALMYLLAFMDRGPKYFRNYRIVSFWLTLSIGNIGNAKLEGLLIQLHMTSSDYTTALVMFFVAYCVFEPPSNLLLKKFRPSRYLPFINLLWGIVMTLMGLVKTYPQFVGTRVCLGACEAGLFPGVVYFLTFWYSRYQLQTRVALFFGAATVAGAFSGLLAYGISFMSGTRGLLGWSWIFILEGIATVVVAILSAFVLHGCDSPEEASFLTASERRFLFHRRKYELSSVGEDESVKSIYVWKAVKDWQVWVHTLVAMSVIIPLYANALFLPSIIHGFGYSTAISQLLTVPPFIFATIATIISALLADRLKRRSTSILIGQLTSLIGFAINISHVHSRGPKYFGTFLSAAGTYSAFPAMVAWLSNNLAPSTKRGVGIAMQLGLGNIGTVIGSVAYRSKDEPHFTLGHSVVIGFMCMGLILTSVLAWVYSRINADREVRVLKGENSTALYSQAELEGLGDRALDFRYSL